MKVRDLITRLGSVDQDALLLRLALYADASEAEEVCVATPMNETWTCERQMSVSGEILHIHYPSSHGLSLGWNAATDQSWSERVVILSTAARARYG
ncbi:hypothetical protein BG61_24065 [Caballeronia glathei]|uniref:Uncharacterized protein n=1 Tax=Caballeronia glathei TaxID=60547 RepID=A0A069PIS0_9BURK|nr:hypothetical protein BG61_24065 [Caballeronia glathei]